MNHHSVEPAFIWPAGHRAALCPVILFDAPSNESSGRRSIGSDYAPSGFDRLLSMFADLDLAATVGVTSEAERFAPTLVAKAAGLNLEVVSWTFEHAASPAESQGPGDLLRHGSTGQVAGLPHSPAIALPTVNGAWVIDGSGGDRPTAFGETCLVPSSPYWVDSVWFDPSRPLPPSSLLEAWSLSLAEVRTQGALMTVLLHAEVSGRLGISSQIMRFLDEVIESGDVWIASAGQIAAWWRQEILSRGNL